MRTISYFRTYIFPSYYITNNTR